MQINDRVRFKNDYEQDIPFVLIKKGSGGRVVYIGHEKIKILLDDFYKELKEWRNEIHIYNECYLSSFVTHVHDLVKVIENKSKKNEIINKRVFCEEVIDICNSMEILGALYNENNQLDDFLVETYPFNQSYDELMLDVRMWKKAAKEYIDKIHRP